jgi:hypothetical protein
MKSKSEEGHRVAGSDQVLLLDFKAYLKTRKLIGEAIKSLREVLNLLSIA